MSHTVCNDGATPTSACDAGDSQVGSVTRCCFNLIQLSQITSATVFLFLRFRYSVSNAPVPPAAMKDLFGVYVVHYLRVEVGGALSVPFYVSRFLPSPTNSGEYVFHGCFALFSTPLLAVRNIILIHETRWEAQHRLVRPMLSWTSLLDKIRSSSSSRVWISLPRSRQALTSGCPLSTAPVTANLLPQST